MVQIIKAQLTMYAIKVNIVNKNNGFEGPGAFVFKNGEKAIFVGYSANINAYLKSEEFKQFTLLGDYPHEGIKYTQIEQYLTENNFLAASLADWLRDSLRPTENKEDFIESKMSIRDICDDYEKADPELKYHIRLGLARSLGEEKFVYSRQMGIEESWKEDKEDKEDKETGE